jgi:hypothetical protein
MERTVELQCGYNQSVRSTHQKLARETMLKRAGYALPIALQRSIWLTSVANFVGASADAVALALHIDSTGRLLPAALEDGLEVVQPGGDQHEALANVLLLLGPNHSITTLALADTIPRYLQLVSNCRTIMVVQEDLGEAIHRGFGWRFTKTPANISLPGFVALTSDGNPATSFCARAIAFAHAASQPDHYYMDSFGAPEGERYAIVANDDARQLVVRAWENWEENSVGKIVVEEATPTPAPMVIPGIVDRKA